jgi:hypothetical protein
VAYAAWFASISWRSSFGRFSRVRRWFAAAAAISTWQAESLAQEGCEKVFVAAKNLKAQGKNRAALDSYRKVVSQSSGPVCELLRLRSLNNLGAALSAEAETRADAVMAYVEFCREFNELKPKLSPEDEKAIGDAATRAKDYVDEHKQSLAEIHVNTQGVSATVSVDQRRVDVELPSPILVVPGKHQIALDSNEESESCSFTVNLKSGESTKGQCWTPEWKYARGQELWDDEVDRHDKRRRACASFQESFDAEPRAHTGFAVARCLEVGGNFEAAFEMARIAQALLREAPQGAIPDKDGLEKGIQSFFRDVVPRLPHLSLAVTKRLPGMTATLERLYPSRYRTALKLTEPDRMIRVASGQWSLVVSAPEHLDWRTSFEVQPDQNWDHPHELTIPALNEPQAGRENPRKPAKDASPPVAAWVVAGGSALSLSGALASHLHRERLASDFNSNGCFTELPQYGGPGCEGLNDDVNLFTGLAIGGYAVGAALGGLSAYLFLRSPDNGTSHRSRSIESTLLCVPDVSQPGVGCAARF